MAGTQMKGWGGTQTSGGEVQCQECALQAGYEISITPDFKRKGEIFVWGNLKSLEAEGCLN